jgi:hypothetical protein
VINPAVFPVAIVKRDEFLALVAKSQLSDGAPSVGNDGNPGSNSDGGRCPILGFVNRELFDSLSKVSVEDTLNSLDSTNFDQN